MKTNNIYLGDKFPTLDMKNFITHKISDWFHISKEFCYCFYFPENHFKANSRPIPKPSVPP